MKIGPYKIGTIGSKVLCAGKIGREVPMAKEPKPCICGKTPAVFKVCGEWEVSCEDECLEEVTHEVREFSIERWNGRVPKNL